MKRLKVKKYLSSLGGAKEISIEERHKKCQKLMLRARIKKEKKKTKKRKKKILNYEHVFWYL
jgi:hypothetical protein